VSNLLDLADRLWKGEVSTEDAHPFTPTLEIAEVADGVAFVSSFANLAAIRHDGGLCLIDTGSWLLAGQQFDRVRSFDASPVSHAIFTHGHIDHVFGLGPFEDEAARKQQPGPRVIAHRAVPRRFDRYRRTGGYNGCINGRQFGIPMRWPKEYRYPDEVYDDHLVVDLGSERLELFHARGETDDHTWAYLPSRRALFTGDFFIWACPNAGNPQKVQRYPDEWAAALRRMMLFRPAVLCPGHGPPILGEARVQRALGETAELLESLCDQTLALMNQGAPLDQILHSVRPPPHLLERPYLRPVYDDPSFVVRAIWRLHGGWYDGNPAHLKPAPDEALAREIAHLAGGASRLADRALQLAASGDLPLAAHLVEHAHLAAPHDPAIRRARASIYEQRASAEPSLMARNIYREAAERSRE
jgi:glyoxylase-like metal-dependent hydrolase (beta-lactamase superfamily II)